MENQPITPTTNTTTLYPNNTTYIKVPNNIILYSCKLNHNILPIYLYSKTHAQYYNNNLIDTNLALIEETFYPNPTRHTQAVSIKNTLKLLGNDVKDETHNKTTINGFPKCVNYRIKIDNVKTTSRLQYYLENDIPTDNYTQITFAEYNYLIDKLYEINTTQDKYISTIDIINLYCYMKMRIMQYKQLAIKQQSLQNIYMKETIDTIASKLSLGNKTIVKHIKLLSSLNMIKINYNNTYNTNKENKYELINDWQII